MYHALTAHAIAMAMLSLRNQARQDEGANQHIDSHTLSLCQCQDSANYVSLYFVCTLNPSGAQYRTHLIWFGLYHRIAR